MKKIILTTLGVVIAINLTLITLKLTVAQSTPLISPLGTSFSVLSTFRRNIEVPEYLVYGYLPHWSLENINYLQLDKITDIAYFGLYLESDGTFRKAFENGLPEPGYNNWRTNKELATLIHNCKKQNVRVAVTIVAHEDDVSDKFLECRPCWDTLINELLKELNYHDIRDVNLNFEYAEYTPNGTADLYTGFVKYLNQELDKMFGDSYIVVSTFADSITQGRVTKVQDLAKVADALFIMGYDFHRPSSSTAGPVAPIGGTGVHGEYDIQTMLKDYLAHSPPKKLLLGVPYYGYNWVVEKEEDYAKRLEDTDKEGQSQSQAYADIMETILENNIKAQWDSLAQVPYFTYTHPETKAIRQVYFDNADSLKVKYRLAKNLDLAGIGIWALGYDHGYQELWNLLGEEFR